MTGNDDLSMQWYKAMMRMYGLLRITDPPLDSTRSQILVEGTT